MVTDGLLPFVLYTEYLIKLWAPLLLLGIHIRLNCLTAHIYPCFFKKALTNQMHCCFSWTLEDGSPLQTTFSPPPPMLSEFHRINMTHVHPERRGVMSDIRVTTKTTTCIQLDLEPDTAVQQANLRPAPLQPFLYWQVMVIGLSGVHFLCSGSLICLSWVWSQTDLEDTKSYHQSLIKITILEKKRRAKLWKRKFAVKDWQGRHNLFNVPLKLTTIKMNVIVWSKTTTLNVIGLLNCLVTNFLIKNCPITTCKWITGK